MKIEINGVEREGQIVSVPRGGFWMGKEGSLSFPLFAYICNAIEEDMVNSEVLICPILDCSFTSLEHGNICDNIITDGGIRDCVYENDIEYIVSEKIRVYSNRGIDEPILYWLDEIVDEFEIHGTPISRSAKEYIERVRREKKLDF